MSGIFIMETKRRQQIITSDSAKVAVEGSIDPSVIV
jgi:hypothetical protein